MLSHYHTTNGSDIMIWRYDAEHQAGENELLSLTPQLKKPNHMLNTAMLKLKVSMYRLQKICKYNASVICSTTDWPTFFLTVELQ